MKVQSSVARAHLHETVSEFPFTGGGHLSLEVRFKSLEGKFEKEISKRTISVSNRLGPLPLISELDNG